MGKADRIIERKVVPKECPWEEGNIKTALGHPEVWLDQGVTVEKSATHSNGYITTIRKGKRSVELPLEWDTWRMITHPASFVPPLEVTRVLTPKGLSFSYKKRWTVTLPYDWIGF